jgi:acyl carrier protein
MNLTKAICRLWSNGVRAQFWPFHACQRLSYNWINLPPYQFAKTSHWLDYKPTEPVWETPMIASENSQSELIQLLPDQSRQGEALFEINPKHELYQLGTKGHEVVEQTLCPASMYNEFVLTASRLLSDAATHFVPQLSGLTMSSPLVLNPVGCVLLRLVEQKSQPGSWEFSLFTRDEQNKHADSIIHATGRVTVSKSETLSTTISHFQSLNGLILQRCNDIESSSMSIGFKGPTAYQAMRLVVTYLDYYHGIQSIYSMGNEAVARISLPATRPPNMGTGFCDPVLIDSFTQVSGILANCFARDEDNEMWVCNFINEITFTQRFVETGRKEQTWIAYAKYEKPTPKKLQCDIFVFEPESGQLVLTIMAISFQKLSIKSLTKTLGRLNGLNKTPVQDTPTKAISSHIDTDFSAYGTTHATVVHQSVQQELSTESAHAVAAHSPVQKVPPSETVTTTGISSGSLQKVMQMLSDIIEISVEEISPDSALEILGIDSLLVTEIFAEVNQRFKISLSHSDFATITDVQGLAQLVSSSGLSPASAPAPNSTSTSTSTSSSTAQSTGSWTQIDMETVVYCERGGTPLSADIYYPNGLGDSQKPLPIGGSTHSSLVEIEDEH